MAERPDRICQIEEEMKSAWVRDRKLGEDLRRATGGDKDLKES